MKCFCEGFRVAVISREKSRLEKLKSFVSPSTKENLTTVVGNVGESGHRASIHPSMHPPIISALTHGVFQAQRRRWSR